MTAIVSNELRYARTKLLLDLAEKGNGKVTADDLLKAVNGSQKLLLNVLWNARRSGYVSVEQVRDGRKIAYWEIKVTGDIPVAPSTEISPLDVKKGAKTKTVKQPKAVKTKKVASAVAVKKKATKSEEDIRAANLARMKAVSAKIAKKAAAKKKKTINVDDVEKTFGTNGEVATSFAIDNGFDSMDGINVRDFLR
jgi:hypothetical protein